MKVRWALHHHTESRTKADHFDLMIEDGDSLATFSFTENPLQCKGIRGTRIHDHDPGFLESGGKLSEGNGRCELVESGECVSEDLDGTTIRAILHTSCGQQELCCKGGAATLRTM